MFADMVVLESAPAKKRKGRLADPQLADEEITQEQDSRKEQFDEEVKDGSA